MKTVDYAGTDPERKLLNEVSQCINRYYSYNNDSLNLGRRDQNFMFIGQWSSADEAEFRRLNKPMFSLNKLYDYYKKALGEYRKTTPSLSVRATDGNVDQKLVNIFEDHLRYIQHKSKSDIIYQTGFENALSTGIGAWEVVTEYEDPHSFNQIPSLKIIDDVFTVFWDIDAVEPTKCDGEYIGYHITMDKRIFDEKYPGIKYPSSYNAPLNGSFSRQNFSWGSNESVTIVRFYKKEKRKFNLLSLSDGREVEESEYNQIKKDFVQQYGGEDGEVPEELQIFLPQINARRKSFETKIVGYNLLADKILEKFDVVGDQLPIVISLGDHAVVNGKEHLITLIRYAREPQIFLNYITSEIAQQVKTARRERFMATDSNIASYEKEWTNPEDQQGRLPYNPDAETRQPPIHIPPTEVSQTLLMQQQQLDREIQSVLGFYEANRGAEGQELSGVAIQQRQMSGNTGIFVFTSNNHRAIHQTGNILYSMIKQLYDSPRKLKTMSKDGKANSSIVNSLDMFGNVSNNIRNVDYDIHLQVGAPFALEKERSLDQFIKMLSLNANSPIFPRIIDLLAANFDLENMPQIVDRLKDLVPPEIVAKEEGKPPPPPQPNPQAMMMQAEMQNKQKELQLKEQELKNESIKTMIDAKRLMNDLNVAGVKANAEVSKAQLDKEIARINALAKISNAHASIVTKKHDTIHNVLSRALSGQSGS